MSKEKKIPFWEKTMWWVMNIGAFFAVACVIPVVPWRYAKVDTNVGNRFVMERYYTLMGATNNLGKSEGWLTMRKKMQRKTEEFGKPSPIAALLGTAAQGLGAGGAAMGCMMWQVCKEHVNSRFMAYSSLGYTGITCMILILLGAIMSVASTIFLGFEQANAGKKKKKKKDDECMEPVTKTAMLALNGFLFTAGGVTTYVCMLGATLKNFQMTAYYPFAGSHAAPFIGGFGAFLMFIGQAIACNRAFQCCGKKKDENGMDGEMGGYGAPPAYGAPPGAYGAYPPPGAYGGYPQQQGGW